MKYRQVTISIKKQMKMQKAKLLNNDGTINVKEEFKSFSEVGSYYINGEIIDFDLENYEDYVNLKTLCLIANFLKNKSNLKIIFDLIMKIIEDNAHYNFEHIRAYFLVLLGIENNYLEFIKEDKFKVKSIIDFLGINLEKNKKCISHNNISQHILEYLDDYIGINLKKLVK